jgi:hypothetical protein
MGSQIGAYNVYASMGGDTDEISHWIEPAAVEADGVRQRNAPSSHRGFSDLGNAPMR